MPLVRDPRVEEGQDAIGRYRAELLSDAGGLTQFGAFVETLWPGSASSRAHWHRSEDEMIYVLEGSVTLVEGGQRTELAPGQSATFKAGLPLGHHLENRTSQTVKYLVIGTRSGDDVVTYVEDGGTVTVKDGTKTYRDADGEIIKEAPYHGT